MTICSEKEILCNEIPKTISQKLCMHLNFTRTPYFAIYKAPLQFYLQAGLPLQSSL